MNENYNHNIQEFKNLFESKVDNSDNQVNIIQTNMIAESEKNQRPIKFQRQYGT